MAVIRDAVPADGPRLVAMCGRFMAETIYGRVMAATPELLEATVITVVEQGIVLVAEVAPAPVTGDCLEGRSLVGMLAFWCGLYPVNGRVVADELCWWVEPEHRGSSIGPRLLAAADARFNAKNVSMVKMVAPIGTSVGDFLQRVGYEAIETTYLRRVDDGFWRPHERGEATEAPRQ